MTPSSTQMAMLAVNLVFFLLVFFANRETFSDRDTRSWAIVSLLVGVAVAGGIVILPGGFDAAVGQGLGGPFVALGLISALEIARRRRRAQVYLGWALETACDRENRGFENSHRYVQRLRDGRAVTAAEAAGLRDTLLSLGRPPNPGA